MPNKIHPIGVTERTAAKLFELEQSQFSAFVESGDLPDGYEIAPGCKRWDVEALRNILGGRSALGDETIKW